MSNKKKNRYAILYIHGFNSSPQSMKSVLTRRYIDENDIGVEFICPQIQPSPVAAVRQLEEILLSKPDHQWHLMGSSLGGYFSTYFAQKYQVKAAIINPAVRPFELLVDYIGKQENPYTGEVYHVTHQHMLELKSLYNEKISKNLYMVMVQTGDEVLDYRQAVEKYQGSELIVQQGGDHSFINYKAMLPKIMTFFAL